MDQSDMSGENIFDSYDPSSLQGTPIETPSSSEGRVRQDTNLLLMNVDYSQMEESTVLDQQVTNHGVEEQPDPSSFKKQDEPSDETGDESEPVVIEEPKVDHNLNFQKIPQLVKVFFDTLHVTEETYKDNEENLKLLFSKTFELIEKCADFHPVDWIVDIIPKFVKQTLKEIEELPQRKQNLALSKPLLTKTQEYLVNEGKFKHFQTQLNEKDALVDSVRKELRQMKIQLKLKTFQIKNLDKENTELSQQLLKHFDSFTSNLKQMSKNLDKQSFEQPKINFDQNTGIGMGDVKVSDTLQANNIKIKKSGNMVSSTGTQIDDVSLQKEIRSHQYDLDQVLQDPIDDLKIDVSNLQEMEAYDVELNFNFVAFSAMKEMKSLKLRDQEKSLTLYVDTFSTCMGCPHFESPVFTDALRSLIRRYSRGEDKLKLLSSAFFDMNYKNQALQEENYKKLITNKFYGPYATQNDQYVFAQRNVRGEQFGWVIQVTNAQNLPELEFYLASNGNKISTVSKITTEGIFHGFTVNGIPTGEFIEIEDFNFQKKVKAYRQDFLKTDQHVQQLIAHLSHTDSTATSIKNKINTVQSKADSCANNFYATNSAVDRIEKTIDSAASTVKGLSYEINSLSSKVNDAERSLRNAGSNFDSARSATRSVG